MSCAAAGWQQGPTLRGRHVQLLPLQESHVDLLHALVGAPDFEAPWYASVPTPDGIGAYVTDALRGQQQGGQSAFLVCDAQGDAVGSTRFYDMVPGVPKLSIGYTWYVPRVRRTGVNTEAKLLLLTHAFETLGCIRVVWETSSHNAASRTAIARLGAQQEGILRNHKRHADGSPRDTVLFSMIDSEWPQARQRLQARLEQGA